jgi:hypothetical protein
MADGLIHFIDEVPEIRHDPATGLVFLSDSGHGEYSRRCMRDSTFRQTIFQGMALIREIDARRQLQARKEAEGQADGGQAHRL